MKGKRTVVTGISFDPQLLELGRQKAKLCGFQFSFSAYVSELVRKDVQCLANLKQQPLVTITPN